MVMDPLKIIGFVYIKKKQNYIYIGSDFLLESIAYARRDNPWSEACSGIQKAPAMAWASGNASHMLRQSYSTLRHISGVLSHLARPPRRVGLLRRGQAATNTARRR